MKGFSYSILLLLALVTGSFQVPATKVAVKTIHFEAATTVSQNGTFQEELFTRPQVMRLTADNEHQHQQPVYKFLSTSSCNLFFTARRRIAPKLLLEYQSVTCHKVSLLLFPYHIFW